MATDIKNDATLSINLLAYWSLDESSGNAIDATGNGYTLTNIGTATYSSGLLSNAITFNGSSQYLEDPTLSDFNFGTGAFSFAGWVKLSSTSVFHAFFTKRGSGGADAGFRFGLRNNVDNALQYYAGSGSVSYAISSSGTISDTTTWHQVAMTRDASGNITFYIDGASSGTGLNTYNLDNTNKSYLGVGEGASGKFMAGSMDEVGIWDKELTSSEIISLYNSGLGIPYESTTTTSTNNALSMCKF